MQILLAGLDAGVNLLDTADVYGDSERLVAEALAAYSGDASSILIATKGGLVVDETGWRRDGRAKHLVEACEASLRMLRRDAIDLYQLHAADPEVPIETSVRALDGLVRRGLVKRIGLSNVGVKELSKARSLAEIASVQVELGPLSDTAIKSGVASEALRNGLLLLAYSPFGGPKKSGRIGRDEVLRRVASRHTASPYEVVLSYLRDLHPLIVPLPGPSTLDHVRSCARHVGLTNEDRIELDARFPRLATLRPAALATRTPTGSGTLHGEPAIVVIMGSPAAGKSTLVSAYEARGYVRLNRDLLGGKLDRLATMIDQRLTVAPSQRRFVLDNTYGTRSTRFAVLEVAARHSLPVRCIWLQTSLEDAQVNACQRMIERYGHILSPEEIAVVSRKDPNSFGPNAIFRYHRSFEAPELSEGFAELQPIAFTRRPAEASAGSEVVLLDLDSCASALLPGSPVSQALRETGAPLWAVAWRPGATQTSIQALSERAAAALQVPVIVRVCPHPAGPPVCWCRKPLPGLPLALMAEHRILAQRVRYVGNSTLDASFARRVGMEYVPLSAFSGR